MVMQRNTNQHKSTQIVHVNLYLTLYVSSLCVLLIIQ